MNREAYVKAVAKRLACSKGRRDEFVGDVESDISDALAAGETWEQVERRMGDPLQVAAEFNEDLSASEIAAGKKRRRTKIIAIVLAVVVVLAAILAAATWWATPHYVAVGEASGHTEQQVLDQAEQVVELFAAGIAALGNETLKSLTNQEVIDSARDLFNGGDWGAFESFGNEYVGEFVYMGKTSNPVQLVAVYEHTTVTFVLAFDGDLQLTEMRVM